MPDEDFPALVADALRPIDPDDYAQPDDPRHPPRILLLYGSLRARSYSRLLSDEAGRLLQLLLRDADVLVRRLAVARHGA